METCFMFVVTVDQRRSRSSADAVPGLLDELQGHTTVRAFQRTAGDEVQGMLDDPAAVVEVTCRLVTQRLWYVGIGVGEVDRPLRPEVRENSGPAFVEAREAVNEAKRSPRRIAVRGARTDHAETAILLLATVLDRRTKHGREAVEAARATSTQAEAAKALGITPQAIGQRLRSAGWHEEQRGRELAVHLLGEG